MQPVIKSALVRSCFTAVFLLLLSSPVWAQGVVAHSGEVAGTVGFSNLTGVDGDKHVNFGASAGVKPYRPCGRRWRICLLADGQREC